MLTVPEAARRAGKNPETIRRWIREGKLTARKVGTQHVLEEHDLDRFLRGSSARAPLPAVQPAMPSDERTPGLSAAVRRSRASALATLIADGRVTPALDPDTANLPMPASSATGVSATTTLLAERERDPR
jgi:excisionase family DNA binding protein